MTQKNVKKNSGFLINQSKFVNWQYFEKIYKKIIFDQNYFKQYFKYSYILVI